MINIIQKNYKLPTSYKIFKWLTIVDKWSRRLRTCWEEGHAQPLFINHDLASHKAGFCLAAFCCYVSAWFSFCVWTFYVWLCSWCCRRWGSSQRCLVCTWLAHGLHSACRSGCCVVQFLSERFSVLCFVLRLPYSNMLHCLVFLIKVYYNRAYLKTRQERHLQPPQ